MKLNDVTPEAYMCGSCGCGCPAVFETDRGTYVIIGKKPAADEIFAHGVHEAAVIVDQAMIKNIA
ncbi:MAG: hypothetical protein HND56_09670 [Pseudomonadota bacterium]|nr:hypothetical protein [Pseudomonadota bacterium]QKK05939.1 MAG: hypothetical protein HND56_09670 [Pseudomonadota bacterium]|tara:strand:+ start:380 stop:574 length:195 start_codon:yes stop_codon:yes gene_type:complete